MKRPNYVKQLRIFSTIFEILKNLPLKGVGGGVLETFARGLISPAHDFNSTTEILPLWWDEYL